MGPSIPKLQSTTLSGRLLLRSRRRRPVLKRADSSSMHAATFFQYSPLTADTPVGGADAWCFAIPIWQQNSICSKRAPRKQIRNEIKRSHEPEYPDDRPLRWIQAAFSWKFSRPGDNNNNPLLKYKSKLPNRSIRQERTRNKYAITSSTLTNYYSYNYLLQLPCPGLESTARYRGSSARRSTVVLDVCINKLLLYGQLSTASRAG